MSSEPWHYQINGWDQLPDAIVACGRAGAIGMQHLLRGLAAGRHALLPLLPTASATKFKKFVGGTAGRPAIILIGDDDGVEAGPAGWRLAERAIAWARAVLLHGAGAEVAHYEGAIRAAQRCHRVLIVECCSATLPAWAELVASAPHKPATLVIVSSDGPHPLPVRREAIQ